MIQQRRIMFVKNSQPLVGVSVRLGKVSGGLPGEEGRGTLPNFQSHYVTDEDGQITCELDSGVSFLEVSDGEDWIECRLDVNEKQSLFVVDLHTHTTGSFKQITGGLAALPGQVFGERYVFENVIGRGGMGVVIKAKDKLLNRDVAIKMLNDEFLENMEAQKIFLEEARSIATLRHPNLVAIYDVTMIDDRAMIVFEFIEGRDLDSIFEEVGRLSEASVLRLGVQLSRALKYLHSKGILHRDIKPANVLMQPDGMIKIIDFGLARPLEQLAIKGTRVRGTPAYMAPEQIEGGTLLAATDIYQLGVSLYEVLSGQLPFSTGNMAYSHVHLDPPDLNASMSLREPQLATLIHACLAKRPEERPTAEDLFQAFQAIYASHAAYYDADTRGVIPNAEALFSETTELTIPDWLRSRSERETLSEMPSSTSRTTLGQSNPLPVEEEDEMAPEGLQRLLVVALGLILLLLGLGGVIVMLLSSPTVDEKNTPSSAEVGALDSPSTVLVDEEEAALPASEKAVEEKKQGDEQPEAFNEELVSDTVKPGEDPVEGEETATDPSPSVPDVAPPTKEANPVRADSEPSISARKTSPPPSTEKVAVEGSANEEEVVEVREVEKAPATDNPPSKVETSGSIQEPEETSPKDGSEESEPKVIRKRIIRKRIIRKVPAASEEGEETTGETKSRAPVSF